MKFVAATIAAAAALLPHLASAHVDMIAPPPFTDNPSTINFPMDASGDNFPCTVAKFDVPGNLPVFEAGSDQSIGLEGSAVHGGGSCQVSFTYEMQPNKNTVFRVVKSYEGGCPIQANGNIGSDPQHPLPPLPFVVPDFMPSGPAVVAWTWFNRIGNREMYMRCAPVRISGKTASFDEFNKLPEIFKANIGPVGNGCITKEGINIKFPNPGPVLVGSGDSFPDGPGCPQPGSNAEQPPSQSPPTENPSTSTTPVSVPAPTHYPVLVHPPSATQPPKVTQPAPAPAPTPPVAKPSGPSVTPPSKPAPPASYPPPNNNNGAACPTNGAIVCTSTTTWAVCNFGKLVPMGQTAAGIQCKDGKMVRAKASSIRRAIRFSADHMLRRRHAKHV